MPAVMQLMQADAAPPGPRSYGTATAFRLSPIIHEQALCWLQLLFLVAL